ncbi:MAG: Na+/H+ antiporter subunit E [Actinomycetota bacterium]
MRRFGLRVGWLVAVWLFLWEGASLANVLSGIAAAVGVLLAFPPAPGGGQGRLRPLAALRFIAYFAWKLVEASAVVAWEIVTPTNRIREGIVAVPMRHVSDLLTTLVANSISLTPGTLTVEVDREPRVLYVHVLHLHNVEDVRRDVGRLEMLALKAFGSDEAIEWARQDTSERGGLRGRG